MIEPRPYISQAPQSLEHLGVGRPSGVRGEGVADHEGGGLPQDAVRRSVTVPVEAAARGIWSLRGNAGQLECAAVGDRDVPAIAVEEDGAIGHRFVEVLPGGKSGIGKPLVVESLPDDGAFDLVGSGRDPPLEIIDVGRRHQLEAVDQLGIPQRVQVVVVEHQRR